MTVRKLIAIDLDGTTLRSDNTISAFTKDILHQVERLGHVVVIATGRPYRISIDFYEELALTSPMVNFNGSLVSKPHDPDWIFTEKQYINKSFVFDLLTHQQNFELEFIAAEYRRKFFLNNFNNVDPEIFGVSSFHAYHRLRADRLTSDPHAILMATRAKDKIEMARMMQDHYDNQIRISAWGGPNGILEIVPKGISKASALSHVLKSLKIDKTEMIAFGDEYNDAEMFQLAQTGYAMKNASPRLIGYADDIIPWSNDEDGVAKKLQELFL